MKTLWIGLVSVFAAFTGESWRGAIVESRTHGPAIITRFDRYRARRSGDLEFLTELVEFFDESALESLEDEEVARRDFNTDRDLIRYLSVQDLSHAQILEIFDSLCGHGIEEIELVDLLQNSIALMAEKYPHLREIIQSTENELEDCFSGKVQYVNTGDTYSTTVIVNENDELSISTYGDHIERVEREMEKAIMQASIDAFVRNEVEPVNMFVQFSTHDESDEINCLLRSAQDVDLAGVEDSAAKEIFGMLRREWFTYRDEKYPSYRVLEMISDILSIAISRGLE